jgi:hypothetical protein
MNKKRITKIVKFSKTFAFMKAAQKDSFSGEHGVNRTIDKQINFQEPHSPYLILIKRFPENVGRQSQIDNGIPWETKTSTGQFQESLISRWPPNMRQFINGEAQRDNFRFPVQMDDSNKSLNFHFSRASFKLSKPQELTMLQDPTRCGCWREQYSSNHILS